MPNNAGQIMTPPRKPPHFWPLNEGRFGYCIPISIASKPLTKKYNMSHVQTSGERPTKRTHSGSKIRQGNRILSSKALHDWNQGKSEDSR